MKAAFLPDRGVIKISGPDARSLLNGLVTTDLERLSPGEARFGALLTPQGKIVVDFLIAEDADGNLLVDCPLELAQSLATKLNFYKLRAKATIENQSDTLGVLAIWDGAPAAADSFIDPRHPALGSRKIIGRGAAESAAAAIGAELADAAAYDAHRIACGVPAGGIDFAYNDAFPHETNMDRLHGVDFDKGCYVGQEVVSRMQHRGTARTRTVLMLFSGAAPAPGTAITAGEKSIGTLGSATGGMALAVLRIDRAADALNAGLKLMAGETELQPASREDLTMPAKAEQI